MGKKRKTKSYTGVSRDPDGCWQFTVEKASGKEKVATGYTTAKVAALMRDEYILRHGLDRELNFRVKRLAKMRNEAYEQMFGRLDE